LVADEVPVNARACRAARVGLAEHRVQAQGFDVRPWDLIRAVLSPVCELSSSERLVFLAIWRHSDREHLAWPSVGLLASETALSPRTVKRAIAALGSAELIDACRRGGTTSVFTVKVAAVVWLLARHTAYHRQRGVDEDEPEEETGATLAPPESSDGVRPDCQTGATEAPRDVTRYTHDPDRGQTGPGVGPQWPGGRAAVAPVGARYAHEVASLLKQPSEVAHSFAGLDTERSHDDNTTPPDPPEAPPAQTDSPRENGNDHNPPTFDEVVAKIREAAGKLEDRYRRALERAADDLTSNPLAMPAEDVIRCVVAATGQDRAALGLPTLNELFQGLKPVPPERVHS
jgi:hypothetical protein